MKYNYSQSNKRIATDRLIWILTVCLFSSFYLTSKNAYGSYVLLGITIIVFLLHSLNNSMKINIPHGMLLRKMIFFSIFCIISSIWALNAADCIEKGVTIFEILICVCVFFIYFDFRSGEIYLLSAIMTAGYIVSFCNLFSVGFGSISSIISSSSIISDTFDNRNSISIFSAMGVVISLYFVEESKHSRKFFMILLDVISIVNIGIIGSKKGILILAIGCFCFYFLKAIQSGGLVSFFKITMLVILGIFAISVLARLQLFSASLGRFTEMINTLLGNGGNNYSTIIRQEYIKKGFEWFLKRPLLGYGMGNAHILANQYFGTDNYLHNNYIELLVNGGIVGFTIYYSIYLYAFTKCVRIKTTVVNNTRNIIIVMIVVLLFCDIASVSYYSKMTYFYFLVFYLYIKNSYKGEETYEV